MMDRTCSECERLIQAYEHTIHCQRIIEHKSASESGFEALLRKVSKRCEAARKAFEEHEAMHMTATGAAGGGA